MEMIVDFPGGDRVDAHFGSYTVMTDQPNAKGEPGSAPTPFSLFLASIATCAGIYVLGVLPAAQPAHRRDEGSFSDPIRNPQPAWLRMWILKFKPHPAFPKNICRH